MIRQIACKYAALFCFCPMEREQARLSVGNERGRARICSVVFAPAGLEREGACLSVHKERVCNLECSTSAKKASVLCTVGVELFA